MQKKYQITVQPTLEPISLTEAREHLRNEGLTVDNDYLEALIVAARQYIEKYLNRALIEQTCLQSWDRVPSNAVFELAQNPLISITSFKYYDENGVLQNYSNYQLDTQSDIVKLVPNVDTVFPSTQNGRLNKIQITYKCGYGDAAEDVPQLIKQAIKIMIAYLYDENRGGVVSGQGISMEIKHPKVIEYLLVDYRLTGV
jgi:uncharacterized phiE125 gp8 family phage protein